MIGLGISISAPPVAHYEDTLKFYEKLMGLKRAQSMATPGPDNIWLFADSGRAIVHVNAVEEGARCRARWCQYGSSQPRGI